MNAKETLATINSPTFSLKRQRKLGRLAGIQSHLRRLLNLDFSQARITLPVYVFLGPRGPLGTPSSVRPSVRSSVRPAPKI